MQARPARFLTRSFQRSFALTLVLLPALALAPAQASGVPSKLPAKLPSKASAKNVRSATPPDSIFVAELEEASQSSTAPPDNAKDAAKDDSKETQAGSKSEAKPETKAEAKTDVKADGKAEAKADSKSEAKPEAKAEASGKPDVKTDPKVEAKAETKPTMPPKVEAKPDDKFTAELKKHCERHFPGAIQGEIRLACVSSATDFAKYGKPLVQTRCRLNYGEEPQLVMACLIGASITDDMLNNKDDFKRKLQLCAENYPVHNEIDAFLQESCLTGIHLPDLMKTEGHARFEACAQISPERSFIGPCAVGLSLAQGPEAGSTAANTQQNKMCDQYFNLHRFHKTYRACMNARSLAGPDLPTKYSDAIKSCSNIMTEANNETERAACLVGLTIYKHLSKQEEITKRFQKCGENKVTYQDRDFLACLTAASLLDFTDKNGAETGCREVFKEAKKNSARGDCVNSLSLF